MSDTSDHDGKQELGAAFHPTHDQIAKRASELWKSNGCPEGTADRDWLQAEEELIGAKALDGTQGMPSHSGSVQSG